METSEIKKFIDGKREVFYIDVGDMSPKEMKNRIMKLAKKYKAEFIEEK